MNPDIPSPAPDQEAQQGAVQEERSQFAPSAEQVAEAEAAWEADKVALAALIDVDPSTIGYYEDADGKTQRTPEFERASKVLYDAEQAELKKPKPSGRGDLTLGASNAHLTPVGRSRGIPFTGGVKEAFPEDNDK